MERQRYQITQEHPRVLSVHASQEMRNCLALIIGITAMMLIIILMIIERLLL